MRHYSAEEVGRDREGGGGVEGGGTNNEGGVEVRRKVVKVTVALTARARNNIGVRLSVDAYTCLRARMYMYMYVECV